MDEPPNSFPQVPPAKEAKFYRARIIERKDFSLDLWMIRVDPSKQIGPFVAPVLSFIAISVLDNMIFPVSLRH